MFNIEPFVCLGKRLASESMPCDLLDLAYADSEWFDRQNIESSIAAIRDYMLCEDQLVEFVQHYTYKECSDKSVALILAGNIPLVGFADVLYCGLCGVNTYIKYSSKDNQAMRWIIGLLKECEPNFVIEELDSQKVDMVIATGSNNSNRYFEYQFSGVRSIMRGSRASVALVGANDSDEQLRALWSDVFLRYSQGCRNVSLLMVSCKEDIERISELWREIPLNNQHFMNCYHQQKAMKIMQNEQFYDIGYATFVSKKSLHAPVSQINYVINDSIDQFNQFVVENERDLQCVLRCEDFGKAQFPQLSDYADNIDVMNFLLQ